MKTNLSKYASKPIALVGVVNHEFINASDAPGQYEAEQCDRQAVTARWLFERPDFTGYLYLAGEHDLGLDPWRVIQGVDALTDGTKIILDVGRTRDVVVDPEFVVYVRRKDVEKEAAKVAASAGLAKIAAKLLAEALIEAASAGSYSPVQAIHDELTQSHGVPGSEAAGEGMGVVLAALRTIAEAP